MRAVVYLEIVCIAVSSLDMCHGGKGLQLPCRPRSYQTHRLPHLSNIVSL